MVPTIPACASFWDKFCARWQALYLTGLRWAFKQLAIDSVQYAVCWVSSYLREQAGFRAHVIRKGLRLQWYDANISLPGCDKNMPGVLIAMARLNRPALMVYGGTIKPGYSSVSSKPIDVVSAFQSYGRVYPQFFTLW